MRRTLAVVFDEISEWEHRQHGWFYGVSGQFEDGSILQVNKKERHYAQELRETLLQLIGIECDYICDDAGQSKNGNQKWKLKAIVDLEGGPIYGNPPQNVGAGTGGSAPTARVRDTAALAPTSSDKDAEIRAAVALKAAVEYGAGVNDLDFVKRIADELYDWLESKSSGPVQSSAGPAPLGPMDSTPAGPGTTSAGADLGEASAPAGPTSEGVAVSGKDPTPSGPKRYTGSPPPGWVGTE